MIYRVLLSATLFILAVPCFAMQKGSVEYDGIEVDYSIINGSGMLKEADSYFEKYQESRDPKMLSTAMAQYYIVTKIYPNDIYPAVQLARVYDEAKNDRLSKEYFYRAISMNKNDAYANYYFGDFYFKRADYRRALRLFKRSFDNGYSGVYDINLKIATIYEKLADLNSAKYYYNKAYSLNPKASALKDKVLQIESLNYDKSEYYREKK